jgi:hypothetical protein
MGRRGCRPISTFRLICSEEREALISPGISLVVSVRNLFVADAVDFLGFDRRWRCLRILPLIQQFPHRCKCLNAGELAGSSQSWT